VIVDSSALVAVLAQEPDAALFSRLMGESSRVRVSAATVLETSLVIGPNGVDGLDLLLRSAGADIMPFDQTQLDQARVGHFRYGRGRGSRARLNLGDSFSYGLAMSMGEPLLFKGNDFALTDVTPAYVPA
jgi:ribonuclease VapC